LDDAHAERNKGKKMQRKMIAEMITDWLVFIKKWII
jgi:hypothetical protein